MKRNLAFKPAMRQVELCLNVVKILKLVLYQLNTPSKADHTAAGWEVDNVEEVVKVLREKGVVFEQYDMTDERGIATMAGVKGAWFKDSEENILSIVQFE